MPDDPTASAAPGTVIACAAGPVELADVITAVESDGHLGALRFEPHVYAVHHFYYAQILAAQKANACNEATARVILSMSFGLFQIMGFNLYDRTACNVTLSIADFLNSKLAQRVALKNFLDSDHLSYTPRDLLDPVKLAHFAEKYNGPGNVIVYSAKILAALHSLGVTA